jgi:hypothetical protein
MRRLPRRANLHPAKLPSASTVVKLLEQPNAGKDTI